MIRELRVTIIKPSSYDLDGWVENYRLGYMPTTTLRNIYRMTPDFVEQSGQRIEIKVRPVDEIVAPNLDYLNFRTEPGVRNLVALVGTYSNQIHRACDIASYAIKQGALAIVGGPHVMSSKTDELQGKGVSFSLGEADLFWNKILQDAVFEDKLKPVYGLDKRWQDDLRSPVLMPPTPEYLRRYFVAKSSLYISRGCPFNCDFCLIYKFAGHSVRSQSVETSLASLRNFKSADIKIVVFTADNANKTKEFPELCDAMVAEGLTMTFMCQCDAQIGKQEWLLEKMSRAGCRFIMMGVESLDRKTFLQAGKAHNHPDQFADTARLLKKYGIIPIFSNIIGFEDDTEKSIREHVRQLKLISPLGAYFFILTPIPGSDQYINFKTRGLITERNLDRFDGTYPCWNHEHLSHSDLLRLLYESYCEYHNIADMIQRFYCGWKQGVSIPWSTFAFGYALLLRHKAQQQVHPLRGGLFQRRLDHAKNYSKLRKQVYGYDLFPLPDSLSATQADLEADQIRIKEGSLLPILVSSR